MEDRFETFTVLIARISRSIRRLKAEEMERLGLKGPHVSCLYYLSLYDELSAATRTRRPSPGRSTIWRKTATSPAAAAARGATAAPCA